MIQADNNNPINYMKKIALLLFSVIWFSACNNDITSDIPATDDTNTNVSNGDFSENDVVKGRMRIKLKEEPTGQIAIRNINGQITTGIRALDGSATALGITRIERTFPYAGKYEGRTRKAGLHLWYDVWFSNQVSTTRAINETLDNDELEAVCSVPVIKLRNVPAVSELVSSLMTNEIRGTYLPWNDTEIDRQWNFHNPGTKSWQAKGADIRVADIWDQYNGNPTIIVAVIDEGIDINHPDLQANLWTNSDEIPGNGIDDDGNGYIDDVHGYNFASSSPTMNPYDHGTHVAGIIGAVSNNQKGVAGIAGGDGTPGSGVKIMCCQNINFRIENNSAAAIKYAADNGAVICQNSWGYTGSIKQVDKDAINYFIENAGCDDNGNQLLSSPMKGGIVLFATNNNNTSNPSDATPADYEKVIGVAAIGPDFKKASYSDYGDYIDICAPGGAQTPTEAMVYSTYKSSSYGYLAGASMACPHVSGVAALIIEKYGVGKRNFTAEQLKEILLNTAYDVDAYNPNYVGKLGSGCVNAAGALQADLPDANSPVLLLKSNPVTNGILQFQVKSELSGEAIISIYNSTGIKVLRKSIKTRQYALNSVDISNLSAGYFVFQYECNGNTIKEKFIKY